VPRLASMRAVLFAVLLCAPAASPARAQEQDACHGPERADTPIDVTLDDLALSAAYKHKAVRTRGQVETEFDTSGRRRYVLRDGLERVGILPCADVGREFEEMATRRPRLEVTGLASDNPDAGSGTTPLLPTTRILVWAFVDVSEAERGRRQVMSAGLAEALGGAEPIGRTVRVLGQFGGRNLLKDLPADSAPDATAWVLRDGGRAVWVVGKRPEGSGFKLNPDYAPDAARWLEVEGKLERCAAGVCLRARKVSLSAPPS
jgi:hypothetical protein